MLKDDIENIVASACDGTWNGLEGAYFPEYNNPPQKLADKLVAYIERLLTQRAPDVWQAAVIIGQLPVPHAGNANRWAASPRKEVMNRIKRLIIECKCGRKLFDKMDVALSGDSLLVLVAPCECATNQVDVAWLKQRYLKYFGYEIPQTQINVFTPEFLAFCLYIIQEASYLKESHE